VAEDMDSNIPPVLYHATYKPRLKSIQLKGLGAGVERNWTDSKRGVVYLALDPDVAESYAETSDMVPDEWLDSIVILKISTAGLDPNKFHIDSNVQDNQGDTVEYHGVIPSSNISLYKQGVAEDTGTKLDTDYFMKEGCGIFAVAMALNEPGSQIYIISNKNGESWSKSFPYEITHVFTNIPNKGQFDVHGKRAPEVMANDFNLAKADYSIKGPFEPNEFFAKFMGSSDAKPLYGTIKDVKQVQDQIKDTLDEMALSTYKTIGDFDKPGPFTGADKKLVPHAKNIEKATKFFEQTPYDFRLFFSNIPGTGKYGEYGPMTPDQIRKIFGADAEEIIQGSEDAITVVYVGNRGEAKVMLTPWVMAHRLGHAIQAGARGTRTGHVWTAAEKHFFTTVNSTLAEHYGKVDRGSSSYLGRPKAEQANINLTPEYNALFNAIGTQRSSRSGQILRPYEFLYEIFAQYLGTGRITFNPFPANLTYGRKAFGNPTKFMNIKPEYRDEFSRKEAADRLAYDMELMFDSVLAGSVGKILVM